MCFRIRKRMRAGACREILAQRAHAGETRARKKNYIYLIESRYSDPLKKLVRELLIV